MTSARAIPPRVGSDLDRRAVLDCLARAEFRASSVCAYLGIADYEALEHDGRTRLAVRFQDRDLRALLIRLFVIGSPVEAADFDAALAPHEASAFRALALVAPLESPAHDAGYLYSPVCFVPLSDGSPQGRTLLIASDRGDTPDGSRFEPFPDIVFPGHGPLTRQFLQLLPTRPARSALDLCSGTGIAALVSDSTAERVTAVDLTERCTEFARFNSWLNGCERVTIRQGDLYDPVCDERFDRIMAHPPYVPALSEKLIYRDGGESGDRLVRGIIAGLPAHLNTGGTFHMLSIGMDTTDAPFEQRVREWLGAAQSEFDLVFAFGSAMEPDEFARSLITRAIGSEPGDFERWTELFARLQLRQVVYGALVARRFEAGIGDAQTRRVLGGPGTGPEGFDWLLKWFDWLRTPGRRSRVLAERPILAKDAHVDIHHGVENGQFVPQRFRLSNDLAPFKVKLDTDGWIIRVLTAFDGRKTVATAYQEGTESGWIPNQLAEADFVDLVCQLAERGFLELADPQIS